MPTDRTACVSQNVCNAVTLTQINRVQLALQRLDSIALPSLSVASHPRTQQIKRLARYENFFIVQSNFQCNAEYLRGHLYKCRTAVVNFSSAVLLTYIIGIGHFRY